MRGPLPAAAGDRKEARRFCEDGRGTQQKEGPAIKKLVSLLVGICALSLFLAPPAHALALQALIAKIQLGKVQVVGIGAKKKAEVTWEGGVVTQANAGGTFMFNTPVLPSDCVGDLSDGVFTIQVVVAGCKIQQVGGGVVATGQTTCWDPTDTSEPIATITCSGTGQDGELQQGAARSYTDNGDGTITDNVTGLIWEKLTDVGDIHDKDNQYTWADALGKIATLNTPSCFAGHCDWRLPNINELQTLVNYGLVSPAIDPAFNNAGSFTQLFTYWSSTTYALAPANASYVDFLDGDVDAISKTVSNYVRAVRGGP